MIRRSVVRRASGRTGSRRRLTLAALGLLLAGLASACSVTGQGTIGPSPAIPASPVDGVVVAIDSAGLGDVRGVTLRLVGGATLRLTLGTLENAARFAPGHLAAHEASGLPVRAWFVVSGGVPVVYRLEDAPVSPSAVSPSSSP
jgi:hypothetical protein